MKRLLSILKLLLSILKRFFGILKRYLSILKRFLSILTCLTMFFVVLSCPRYKTCAVSRQNVVPRLMHAWRLKFEIAPSNRQESNR